MNLQTTRSSIGLCSATSEQERPGKTHFAVADGTVTGNKSIVSPGTIPQATARRDLPHASSRFCSGERSRRLKTPGTRFAKYHK